MTELDDKPAHFESAYPLQEHIGFEMIAWDAEHVVFRQAVVPHIANRYGIPHGGVYAMLLDTAMGYAGCYTGDEHNKLMAMTLSLTVNFISRPRGDVLLTTGRKRGGGRRTFFADGEILDETGELIATGSGSFRYRS